MYCIIIIDYPCFIKLDSIIRKRWKCHEPKWPSVVKHWRQTQSIGNIDLHTPPPKQTDLRVDCFYLNETFVVISMWLYFINSQTSSLDDRDRVDCHQIREGYTWIIQRHTITLLAEDIHCANDCQSLSFGNKPWRAAHNSSNGSPVVSTSRMFDPHFRLSLTNAHK